MPRALEIGFIYIFFCVFFIMGFVRACVHMVFFFIILNRFI